MQANMITPKDIVRKYNIPYSIVNHYTIIGLLNIADRKKNIRLYNESEVKERLAKILELRSKGYPLHLIKKELLK